MSKYREIRLKELKKQLATLAGSLKTPELCYRTSETCLIKLYTDNWDFYYQLASGYGTENVLAAIIKAGCRYHRFPVTTHDMKDVALIYTEKGYKSTRLDVDKVKKAYKLLIKECKLNLPTLTGEDYVPYIVDKLSQSHSILQESIQILSAINMEDVSGSPKITGAAAVFIACQEQGTPLTYTSIEKRTGISDTALRKRVKKVQEGIKNG